MGIFNRIVSFFNGEKKPSKEEIDEIVKDSDRVLQEVRGDKRYDNLIKDTHKWKHFTEEDLTVPRNLEEIKDLGNFLMGQVETEKELLVTTDNENEVIVPKYLKERIPEIKNIFEESEFEHSGDHDTESEVVRTLYDNYYMAVDKAVGNDEELAKKYRRDIDKKLKGSTLSANGNFQILYTLSAKENGYVDRIANNLEKALATYTNVLNVKPYWPHGNTPIVVEVYQFFGKLASFKGYTYPNYAIEINELFLGIENGEDNDPLEATPAHELFHKIQYNYGYKTEWFKPQTHDHMEGVTHSHTDNEPDDHYHNEEIFSWFSEGTASWGEFYVTNNISNPTKMSNMLQSPETPLFKNNAESLPFWNFVFNHIYKDKKVDVHPMNILLNQLKKTEGQVITTLIETVRQADPSIKNMNDLFMKFCNYRRKLDVIEIDGRQLSFRSVIDNSNNVIFDIENDDLEVSPLACKGHFHKFYQPLEEDRILVKIVPYDSKDCLICEIAVNKEDKTHRLRYNRNDKVYSIIIDRNAFQVEKITSIMLMVAGKMGSNEYYGYKLLCEDLQPL